MISKSLSSSSHRECFVLSDESAHMNGFKPHPGSQFADLPCCCASRPSTYLTTPPSHGFHKGSKGCPQSAQLVDDRGVPLW